MRLSAALSGGLLALPFDGVVPGATAGDPELGVLLARLRAARAALSDRRDPALSAVDAVLVPTLLFERLHKPRGPLEPPCGVVAASVTDFLLLDVTPEAYAAIGGVLGEQRWAPAPPGPPAFPVRGLLWQPHKRVVVPLECRVGSRPPIILHMLLETGAPGTLLCADSLHRLGFTGSMPAETFVMLHGCPTQVTLSHSHFATNDVLGADWLAAARAIVTIDYGMMTVSVDGSAPHAMA